MCPFLWHPQICNHSFWNRNLTDTSYEPFWRILATSLKNPTKWHDSFPGYGLLVECRWRHKGQLRAYPTHRIPYYWKRHDELRPVITHTKWGASSPKVFVAASTQSKLTSESVAIMLSSQLTTKMTNFVVFGCFWTPLKTEPKITKF